MHGGDNNKVCKSADIEPGLLESQDKQIEYKTSLQSQSEQQWGKNSQFQENNGQKNPPVPQSRHFKGNRSDWQGLTDWLCYVRPLAGLLFVEGCASVCTVGRFTSN